MLPQSHRVEVTRLGVDASSGRCGWLLTCGDAWLGYQEAGGYVEVAMLEVPEALRRQGRGTALVETMLATHQPSQVNLVTDEAPAFWDAIRTRHPQIGWLCA